MEIRKVAAKSNEYLTAIANAYFLNSSTPADKYEFCSWDNDNGKCNATTYNKFKYNTNAYTEVPPDDSDWDTQDAAMSSGGAGSSPLQQSSDNWGKADSIL